MKQLTILCRAWYTVKDRRKKHECIAKILYMCHKIEILYEIDGCNHEFAVENLWEGNFSGQSDFFLDKIDYNN